MLRKPNEKFEHKPIMIVGTSTTGKSIGAETIAEELYEQENCSVLFFFDVNNVFESAFAMFKATEKYQLKRLAKIRSIPESKPLKIHCLFSLKGLEKEIKEVKKKFKSPLLPEMDFFVLDIAKLSRIEAEYLCETEGDKGSVRLLINSISELKKNEGMYELNKIIKKNSRIKTVKFHGKSLSEEEPIADRKDERELKGILRMFEKDNLLMPSNFKINVDGITLKPLNMREILEDKQSYHVFISKFASGDIKDSKLSEFLVYHYINEFDRYIEYSPRPVVVVVEEIDSLSEFRAKGRKHIFDIRIGEIMKRIRKMGVTFIVVGTEYTKIGEKIHSRCNVKLLFRLSTDDLEKMKKVHNYGRKILSKIPRLNIGEFLIEGFEETKMEANVPKHGHKHTEQDFYKEYRTHYPDKLKDYTPLIKAMKQHINDENKRIKSEEKRLEDLKKRSIKRDIERKAKKEGKTNELKEKLQKLKEEKKVSLKKRNELIIKEYNNLLIRKLKISSRIIESNLNESGIKCSYRTVQKILKKNGINLKRVGNSVPNISTSTQE
jgi:hypothetical protein